MGLKRVYFRAWETKCSGGGGGEDAQTWRRDFTWKIEKEKH